VTCAVATLVTLVVLAITTDWYARLFGFLTDVCTGDDCPPVPYGVDFYIYPVVWGGVGAAISAALIGPVVSLLRGWYLSFWPLLAFGILVVTSVAGSALTAFSVPYWHWQG
jgi:hypothetical protein